MTTEHDVRPAVAEVVSGDDFRRVLGHLPTGVTVVTGFDEGRPVGFAANSVTAASLGPPMILLCPARTSESWPAIRRSGRLCVNVLAHHAVGISRRFAHKGIDRFADIRWLSAESGPRLEDAAAWIECTIRAEHPAGDHTIVVAGVDRVAVSDVCPDALIFVRGEYGVFAPAPVLDRE